jgi:hypothetical protein
MMPGKGKDSGGDGSLAIDVKKDPPTLPELKRFTVLHYFSKLV